MHLYTVDAPSHLSNSGRAYAVPLAQACGRHTPAMQILVHPDAHYHPHPCTPPFPPPCTPPPTPPPTSSTAGGRSARNHPRPDAHTPLPLQSTPKQYIQCSHVHTSILTLLCSQAPLLEAGLLGDILVQIRALSASPSWRLRGCLLPPLRHLVTPQAVRGAKTQAYKHTQTSRKHTRSSCHLHTRGSCLFPPLRQLAMPQSATGAKPQAYAHAHITHERARKHTHERARKHAHERARKHARSRGLHSRRNALVAANHPENNAAKTTPRTQARTHEPRLRAGVHRPARATRSCSPNPTPTHIPTPDSDPDPKRRLTSANSRHRPWSRSRGTPCASSCSNCSLTRSSRCPSPWNTPNQNTRNNRAIRVVQHSNTRKTKPGRELKLQLLVNPQLEVPPPRALATRTLNTAGHPSTRTLANQPLARAAVPTAGGPAHKSTLPTRNPKATNTREKEFEREKERQHHEARAAPPPKHDVPNERTFQTAEPSRTRTNAS